MVDSTVSAMTWNIWWRFGPRWRDRQPAIILPMGDMNAAVDSPVLRPVPGVLTDTRMLTTRSTGFTRQITAPSSPIFDGAADTVAS
jgi:hypothetical protein